MNNVFLQGILHLGEHSRAKGEAHAKVLEGLWIRFQAKDSGPAGRNTHHLFSYLGVVGIKHHWVCDLVVHDIMMERQKTFIKEWTTVVIFTVAFVFLVLRAPTRRLACTGSCHYWKFVCEC